MKIEHISECFLTYASEQGDLYDEFPLGVEVEEFGGPYIEISDSGNLAMVAKDRGEECMREQTLSPDVMAKWIYEIFNKGKCARHSDCACTPRYWTPPRYRSINPSSRRLSTVCNTLTGLPTAAAIPTSSRNGCL